MRRLARITVGLLFASLLAWPLPTAAQTQPRTIATDELARTKAGSKDWITYGGALNNQRYSTLDQISTSNVSQLRGAWMTRLGSGRGSKYRFEADPLVVDGVMYIPTGNDDIFALDARTGKKIWEWDSDIPQVNDLICCGWDNRGIAVGDGRIYSGMLDGSFVALDQYTGKLLWRTQLEDFKDGYSMTGAYRYIDGLVFTGMSGGENGVRGRVYGLDARTGKEVWRFYTVPGPGDIGGDTWPTDGFAYQHGGATVWQGPAIDADLGMLYFSTGNAGPDYAGSVRAGDNLFAASIVALDYRTGQYRWHFQEVHHDIWDYDAPSPVVLFDQTYNGEQRKGLYQCGKTGWCYFLDRSNGQPLIGIDEKPVPQDPRNATAATQPFPRGDAFVKQCGEAVEGFPVVGCIFAPFFDLPVVIQPYAGGGAGFNPTTYDPQTGFVYVMGDEQNFAYATRPQTFELGRRYTGSAVLSPPGSDIKSTLTALDSRTNTIVWQKERAGESNRGALSTAGGLVIHGQPDGKLIALDARSGDELWRFQTGWGISAPPMTYSVDGKQYISVASGGNRGGVTTVDGDAVWSFSLDGVIDELPAPVAIATRVEITGPILQIGDPLSKAVRVGDPPPTGTFSGTLSMADYSFLPQRVQVPVGTTLSWSNDGSVVHTASEIHQKWDTGDVNPGDTGSLTFDTAGTFTYSCKPHPWMLGQVVVQ